MGRLVYYLASRASNVVGAGFVGASGTSEQHEAVAVPNQGRFLSIHAAVHPLRSSGMLSRVYRERVAKTWCLRRLLLTITQRFLCFRRGIISRQSLSSGLISRASGGHNASDGLRVNSVEARVSYRCFTEGCLKVLVVLRCTGDA